MTHLTLSPKRRNSVLLFFLTGLLIFSACKITLIPNYSETIANQIQSTAKEVDKFYLSMLDTTVNENGGRAFAKFAEEYVNIEAELNSLVAQNKVRPLNENSTKICEINVQLWTKYKNEHKQKDGLSNGIIQLNQKTFSDLFFAMQVAEKAKQIVNNPPQ